MTSVKGAHATMPRITFTDSDGTRRTVTFEHKLSVGRHPDQDIQILERVVSKEHAVIERLGNSINAYVLFDVGSRNGTLLNGAVVTDRVRVYDGDRVTVGATELTFRADSRVTSNSSGTRVKITDPDDDSAVQKRLKETNNNHFPPADQVATLEQLKADYEKLRIANELNRALSLEFDLENLLNRILQKAFEMFAADRGAIMLVDPESGEAVPAATRERYPDPLRRDIPISRSILNEVLTEKAALLSTNAQLDSRFSKAKSVIMHSIKATMSVPLMYRDRLLGVIHLESQLTSGAFTEKDLQLLNGFANQAAIAIEHSRLVDRVRQDALVREQLGRLLPQELVDEVIAGRVDIKKGGDMRYVSVLFADIRGFTSMCERQPAQTVVTMLNEYFEIMVDVIFKHGGTLDKFVGDEIMAVWGAPIAVENHAERAVMAAIEMQAALRAFNEERLVRRLEPLGVGIGVNTGEVVAGYMGSNRAMDYTIVGDVVNTGSRLCSAASTGEIIVSPDVVAATPGKFRTEELPARTLKGKREPVVLYRVIDRTA
jgi:adenylate cyclase